MALEYRQGYFTYIYIYMNTQYLIKQTYYEDLYMVLVLVLVQIVKIVKYFIAVTSLDNLNFFFYCIFYL